MNKQEYKHIRTLAWDLLIDANISQLPVNINSIAKLYNLQYLINGSKSLYENTISVSKGILKIFGIYSRESPKYLAIRILAPMIVFKELGTTSAEELCELSGLPPQIADQRFKRLEMLIKRNAFQTFRLETIVLSQFREWIDNQ